MTNNSLIAAAIFAAAAFAAPAVAQMPAGNAVAGAKVFTQCKTCHASVKGVNRIGPSLHDIVGRKAGAVAGYNYSVANKNSGILWTDAQLFQYLEAPRKVMPGTKMAFAGLKKPQDRADIIAYLKTQKG